MGSTSLHYQWNLKPILSHQWSPPTLKDPYGYTALDMLSQRESPKKNVLGGNYATFTHGLHLRRAKVLRTLRHHR